MKKKPLSFYGLPSEVKFCSKCVISNQRPRSVIEFKNKNNKKKGIEIKSDICSACKYHGQKNNEIDWLKRESELIKILNKYRRKDGYDCVVPGSGGKDSGYTAHILKYKYGMNPLTVTWAPHLYTDVGWKNLINWSHVGGLDNLLFTPNGKLHRYLTKIAFQNLLHPFQPFIIGQRMIGPKIASKFKIPLVIYGENSAEYGNNISENKSPLMDVNFFSTSNNKNLTFGKTNLKNIVSNKKFSYNDFEPYLPLNHDEIKKNKTKVFYLGYFLKWDPQENYYYAAQNTGYKVNKERTQGSYSKYSSIDDKIDYFHYYTTFIKFGLGRASYDASQEIRNEKITRDEGIKLVKDYDSEFPYNYFQSFLDYLNISESQFFKIVDKFRSPHLWSKNKKGEWDLKYAVYKDNSKN